MPLFAHSILYKVVMTYRQKSNWFGLVYLQEPRQYFIVWLLKLFLNLSHLCKSFQSKIYASSNAFPFSSSDCYPHFTEVLQFKCVGVFLNNSNFYIWGIWLLVPCCTVLGGVFPPTPHPTTTTRVLSKWFISNLGNMILYFRNYFQNLAANQEQNHTALHQCNKY